MSEKPWPTLIGWFSQLVAIGPEFKSSQACEVFAACEDEALERACRAVCNLCGESLPVHEGRHYWAHPSDDDGPAYQCTASRIRDLMAQRRASR